MAPRRQGEVSRGCCEWAGKRSRCVQGPSARREFRQAGGEDNRVKPYVPKSIPTAPAGTDQPERARVSCFQRERHMYRMALRGALLTFALTVACVSVYAALPTQIQTQSGLVEGTTSADGNVRVFEGIAF